MPEFGARETLMILVIGLIVVAILSLFFLVGIRLFIALGRMARRPPKAEETG